MFGGVVAILELTLGSLYIVIDHIVSVDDGVFYSISKEISRWDVVALGNSKQQKVSRWKFGVCVM